MYGGTATLSQRQKQGVKQGYVERILSEHLRALLSSLGAQIRAPFASFLTYAVIAIALALPSGFLVMLSNVQTATATWDQGAQISLFLKTSLDPSQVAPLIAQLRDDGRIANVRYISPEQGLKQFEADSGFVDLQKELHQNPLPGVLEIQPAFNMRSPLALQQIFASLKELPEVDNATLDLQWIKRLFSIMSLLERAIYAIAALLGLGVILIVGNTIRLMIENRREEILVLKLVGATHAFIRRPFIYTGLIVGFLGGLFAIMIVGGLLSLLYNPVARLALLYHSHFILQGLGFSGALLLLVTASGLACLGAWLAMARHLK